jgi:hypothetical protein
LRKAAQIRFHGWSKHKSTSPSTKAESPASKKMRLEQNAPDEEEEPLEVPLQEDDEGTTVQHPHGDGDGTTQPRFLDPLGFPIYDTDMVIDDGTLQPPQPTESLPVRDVYKCIINHPGRVAHAAASSQLASLSTSFSTDFYGLPRSQRYFQAEHKERQMGLREIVAKSQFGLTSMAPALAGRDVAYASEVARFTHSLSRGQREHFAKVLQMTVEKVNADRKNNEQPDKPWKCFVPTTYLDIRRQYTGYPDSFLNLLPVPLVQPLQDSFAFIRLKEVVQNFLAHGYPLSTIPSNLESDQQVSNIVESRHCRTRLKEIEAMYPDDPVLVLWMLEWSDGYDPHGFSKSNRGRHGLRL